MKNLIKEFGSSIYNPTAYAQIGNKSLKSIFVYMLKIDLIVSICATIVTIVYLSISLGQFAGEPTSTVVPVVVYVSAVITAFFSVFITVFITWILYGFVFGLLILLVSTITKNKISYTNSIKTALYALSLGVILAIIPNDYLIIGSIVAPIIIAIINIKKSK